MKFLPTFLDEIRARIPVSEIVGEKVRLKKQGREWAGLSPFNAERTPSFFVNDQKGFYHDFSSGRHGDVFRFLMETEGLSFPEAVERLASRAGLEMPRFEPADAEREKARAGLHETLAHAQAWFEAQLKGRAGEAARAYLDRRGLSEPIRREFGIGFAPDARFALRDHLAAKGASAQTMIDAGLLIHGEGIAVPYDRFRDRVTFPIADRAGKVIAFGGRAMSAEAKAKYLNSPETELFHKGAGLYNFHRARKPASDKGRVVAVEGYVDAIALHSAGIPETVASLGTALTPEQMQLMWRLAPEPILCFDGDRAGRKAAWRAIDVALPLIGPGRSLRFALLPEGQDPDDLVRSGGPAAAAAVVDGASPLADMLFARALEEGPLDTPERRAAFERGLHDAVGRIADETLRRHYRAEVDQRMAALFRASSPAPAAGAGHFRQGQGRGAGFGGRRFAERDPRLGFAGAPLAPPSAALAATGLLRRVGGMSPRHALILSICARMPELLDVHVEEVAELDLPPGGEAAALRDRLIAVAGEAPEARADIAVQATALRVLAAVRPADGWVLAETASALDAAAVLRQALALNRRAGALHCEMRAAEARLARDPSEDNQAALYALKAQLADVEGTEASMDGFGAASGRGGQTA